MVVSSLELGLPLISAAVGISQRSGPFVLGLEGSRSILAPKPSGPNCEIYGMGSGHPGRSLIFSR